jgi:hypothetical protein
MCVGNFVRTFCDPNDLEKQNQNLSASEQNGLKIKRFQNSEQSDTDEMLKWFKKEISVTVPVSALPVVTVLYKF